MYHFNWDTFTLRFVYRHKGACHDTTAPHEYPNNNQPFSRISIS